MDFRLKDKLEVNGINVEKGLARYLDSEQAYFEALKDFFNDNSFNEFIHFIDLNLSLAITKSTNLPNVVSGLGMEKFSNNIKDVIRQLKLGKIEKNTIENLVNEFNNLKEIIDLL